jgi:hypothetical protein
MGADSHVRQRTTRALRRWRCFAGRDLGRALVALDLKRVELVVRMDPPCGSPPVRWRRRMAERMAKTSQEACGLTGWRSVRREPVGAGIARGALA